MMKNIVQETERKSERKKNENVFRRMEIDFPWCLSLNLV